MTGAFDGSTCGFHPLICPPSVTKMNTAGLLTPFFFTRNPVPPLNTTPVGAESFGKTFTMRGVPIGNGCPTELYTVETLGPLSEIQNGPVGLNANPQGLTRFASTKSAETNPSETRLR